MNGKKIGVYYATPLCRKCRDGVSKVKKVADQEGAEVEVRHSIWKRIKYGAQLLRMPVVVVDGKSFSVLHSFKEEALAAELRQ